MTAEEYEEQVRREQEKMVREYINLHFPDLDGDERIWNLAKAFYAALKAAS